MDALGLLGYNIKGMTPRAYLPAIKRDKNKLKSILGGYDGAKDTPWFLVFKELDEIYPGAKFIFTYRDEESWYKSARGRFGSLRRVQKEIIYGKGKGLMEDKEHSIKQYQKHNNEVLEYFKDRPNDLLKIDITKGVGWEEICHFLGVEIPAVDFPYSNKSDFKKGYYKPGFKSKFRFYRHKYKNLVHIWWWSKRGYIK
jgi:hypothetical protein